MNPTSLDGSTHWVGCGDTGDPDHAACPRTPSDARCGESNDPPVAAGVPTARCVDCPHPPHPDRRCTAVDERFPRHYGKPGGYCACGTSVAPSNGEPVPEQPAERTAERELDEAAGVALCQLRDNPATSDEMKRRAKQALGIMMGATEAPAPASPGAAPERTAPWPKPLRDLVIDMTHAKGERRRNLEAYYRMECQAAAHEIGLSAGTGGRMADVLSEGLVGVIEEHIAMAAHEAWKLAENYTDAPAATGDEGERKEWTLEDHTYEPTDGMCWCKWRQDDEIHRNHLIAAQAATIKQLQEAYSDMAQKWAEDEAAIASLTAAHEDPNAEMNGLPWHLEDHPTESGWRIVDVNGEVVDLNTWEGDPVTADELRGMAEDVIRVMNAAAAEALAGEGGGG